jgi:hypothetical protein
MTGQQKAPRIENDGRTRQDPLEPPEALKNEKYINEQCNTITIEYSFWTRAITRHEGPPPRPDRMDNNGRRRLEPPEAPEARNILINNVILLKSSVYFRRAR